MRMMEHLPASRAFLTLIGVDINLRLSVIGLCWRYFVRLFLMLTMIGMVLLQLYNILFLDTVWFMAVFKIVITGLHILMYARMLCKGHHLLPLLRRSF